MVHMYNPPTIKSTPTAICVIASMTYAPATMSLMNQIIKPKLRPFLIPSPGIDPYSFEYIRLNIVPKIMVSKSMATTKLVMLLERP